MEAQREQGQRGAILFIMAMAVSLLMLTYGFAYLKPSSDLVQLANVHGRRAMAIAAAQGGVTIGVSKCLAAPAAAEVEIGRARVNIRSEKDGAGQVVLHVEATVGEGPDAVVEELVARVSVGPGGKASVLSVIRQR